MSFEFPSWRRGLLVAAVVAGVWLACFRFPVTWTVTGIGEANRPFMDLYGILAARDAVAAGVNPYLPNDFDPYHRPHVYSDWWLAGSGLGRVDAVWLGVVLLAAFLLSAVGFVRLRNKREALYLAALLISPAFLLAINRANNDLVVFVLVTLGLWSFRGSSVAAKAVAVVLFAVAAALKYTPLVTLVVLLDLRTRRGLLAALGLYAAVLLLAWPGMQAGMQHLTRFTPEPEWLYAYGAPVLARNWGLAGRMVWLVPGGLLLGWALWCAMKSKAGPLLPSVEQAAEREFMCGAAMLVGMFFMGSSFVYKLVFALWLLPRLWRLADTGGGEARWGSSTRGLLLGVVWLEGLVAVILNLLSGPQAQLPALRVLPVALALSQLLTWALVACLARFLLIYLVRRARELGSAPPPTAV